MHGGSLSSCERIYQKLVHILQESRNRTAFRLLTILNNLPRSQRVALKLSSDHHRQSKARCGSCGNLWCSHSIPSRIYRGNRAPKCPRLSMGSPNSVVLEFHCRLVHKQTSRTWYLNRNLISHGFLTNCNPIETNAMASHTLNSGNQRKRCGTNSTLLWFTPD